MFEFLNSIKNTFAIVITTIASIFSSAPVDVQEVAPAPSVFQENQNEQSFGALQPVADFRTSLAYGISDSATSMVLVSTTTTSGETLVQGKEYGFKIGGREYVRGTLSSGRTITGMTRGLSLITGTTTVSGISEQWGRGTAVELTDAPILLEISNKISGIQNIDNALTYSSSVGTTSSAFPSTYSIPNRGYVDALSFGAVPEASETASGFIELASGCEVASSTRSGSVARLGIPATIATSTYNSSTANCKVVVTGNTGKIDSNFVATSTLFGTGAGQGLATSTAIGSFSAYNIGKNTTLITTTGTSTFSVPSGITKLFVQVQGPGSSGGSCSSTAGADCGAGGGGAGGYSEEYIDVTGTTTIQFYIGTSNTNTWTTFGTNGFYLYATSGSIGSSNSAGGLAGGTGGCGFGGDLNICGSSGERGKTAQGGKGGSSYWGFGAIENASGDIAGVNAPTGYGNSGSGGSQSGTSGGQDGGTGNQGAIKITW